MKKEDFQGSHQGSAENIGKGSAQKNKTADADNTQKSTVSHQAGLGRDRMTDIEDEEGMSGRDNYAGSDNERMSNQNKNERTGKL
jgi:hypothetical protein